MAQSDREDRQMGHPVCWYHDDKDGTLSVKIDKYIRDYTAYIAASEKQRYAVLIILFSNETNN